ncbi:MAG TPA: DNA translocase FtsK 4TM domain-containing protein, partial [Longimicrobiaceae bacterium]
MARKKSPSALDDRLQRELWALALLALAVLLALAFIPPWWMGTFGTRLFPTGNIVGVVGAVIAAAAWVLFGISGYLLPAFPAVWAAHVLGRVDRGVAWRATGLLAGLCLLVPMAIFAFTLPSGRERPSAGWIGEALGTPLSSVFGWLGAGLVLTFALAAVCVVTLGWNPLRSLFRGGRSALGGARRGVAAGAALLPRSAPVGAPADRAALEQLEATPPFWESDEDTLPDPPSVLAPRPAAAAAAAPAPASPAAPRPKSRRGAMEVVAEDPGDPASPDLPATSLLTPPPPADDARNRQALDGLGQALVAKLATFRIDSEIIGMTVGPVVTQFEVSPAPGIKVARIANLDADLALALRAPSVRIVAPIPGKGAVGVEVPNPEPQMVYFREVLESPAFRATKAQLPLALGKDIGGKPYVADLARMPHLLIAGATGSGKSVCVNTIITSLIYRHSPRALLLLMVDPKMVELSVYNDLPHLRHPVVTDNSEAAGVLKWAVLEMEWRYALLSANNVRNLQDFNRRVNEGILIRSPEPLGEEGDPERYVYKSGPL